MRRGPEKEMKPRTWTDATWNPIVESMEMVLKCHPVISDPKPDCKDCRPPKIGCPMHTIRLSTWEREKVIRFLPERLLEPFVGKLQMRASGRMVCLSNRVDLWDTGVTDSQRILIHGAMLLSPWNNYQDLTQNPKVAVEWLNRHTPAKCAEAFVQWYHSNSDQVVPDHSGFLESLNRVIQSSNPSWDNHEHIGHIHRYASVSDRFTAAGVIPHLLRIPAAVRGINVDPLLGSIDLSPYLVETSYGVFPGGDPRQFKPDPDASTTDEQETHRRDCLAWEQGEGKNRGPQCAMMGDGSVWNGTGYGLGAWHNRQINHVIISGETGRKARPCAVRWVQALVDQCSQNGCPVFVKRLGSNPATVSGKMKLKSVNGSDPGEWPESLRVQQNARIE